MTARRPAEVFPPGEFLREILEEREWTQLDMAEILGRPVQMVNELISGKRGITPETAQGLAAALDTSPELWLNLEQAYKLRRASSNQDDVKRRSKLYSYAPVSDMLKRGWIEPSENIEVMERQILSFYCVETFEQQPPDYKIAARMSTSYTSEMTSVQRAWLFRSVQLSKCVAANHFSKSTVKAAIEKLKMCLHEPVETRHVARILSQSGIRFVVVQPFAGSKIDGACFWLDESTPVIALSMRYDRVDNFWFTLFHELKHCIDGQTGIDMDLDGSIVSTSLPPYELAANEFATENLISQTALTDFIARKGPLYSTRSIEAFAHIMHVHPGIIVGQLQMLKEIHWKNFRKLLVPVRMYVVDSTLTDGWGMSVPAAM